VTPQGHKQARGKQVSDAKPLVISSRAKVSLQRNVDRRGSSRGSAEVGGT
jgi:hypothetical protein